MIPILPLLGLIMPGITEVLKRVLPPEKMSESERAKLEQDLALKIQEIVNTETLSQIEVNKEEAKSPKLFVAGWRPFIGWVCGTALAYNFVLQPFLAFGIGAMRYQLPPLPILDMGSLMTIVLGMLGLGGMRTFEKLKGVDHTPEKVSGPNPGFWKRALGRDEP